MQPDPDRKSACVSSHGVTPRRKREGSDSIGRVPEVGGASREEAAAWVEGKESRNGGKEDKY